MSRVSRAMAHSLSRTRAAALQLQASAHLRSLMAPREESFPTLQSVTQLPLLVTVLMLMARPSSSMAGSRALPHIRSLILTQLLPSPSLMRLTILQPRTEWLSTILCSHMTLSIYGLGLQTVGQHQDTRTRAIPPRAASTLKRLTSRVQTSRYLLLSTY